VKIAHLADLHLGFRQFYRETAGQNTREIDVANALRRTVDDLLTQRPDIVVVAGDVFHSKRPHNAPIMLLFNQLTRIRQERPETRIVIVAGNHDTSLTTGLIRELCILPLYEHLGVEIVLGEPKAIALPGVTITAVPHGAASQIIKPDPRAALNVLVIHGDVPGLGNWEPPLRDKVDPDELERMGWDYVALGHYHVCRQVGPQMWYSGSLEYTSSNPWGELQEQNILGVPGKGYLLVEPPCPPVFRQIGPTRRFVDLPPIEGTDKSAAQLDAEIASRVAETEIEDAVVRLVVREVRRDVKHALNHRQITEWKARALHFQLELRRCEAEQSTPTTRAAMHRRLDETVEAFLRGRQLPPDLEQHREQTVQLGMQYLKDAAIAEDPYGLDEKSA
jgi:DNA repair exonuclease SbcCD nuclease subunit